MNKMKGTSCSLHVKVQLVCGQNMAFRLLKIRAPSPENPVNPEGF
jgi:hypothetical protein